MRSHLGETRRPVPVPRLPERPGEIDSPPPARPIVEPQRMPDQGLAERRRNRAQCADIARPGRVHGLAGGDQCLRPQRQFRRRGPGLERRIALTERPPVRPPVRQEAMFHVEHAGIDVPPALARPGLDQLMQARIQDVHRQHAQHFRLTLRRLAIEPAHQTASPELHAQPTLPARAVHRDTEDAQPIPVVPDQSRRLPQPERAAPPEQIDRFEKTRLAGPVRAEQVVPVRIEIHGDLAQTAYPVDPQVLQRHRARGIAACGDYSRIGITTYFIRSEPGATIRQLELESVTCSSTSSPPTAPSASSK